MHIIVQVNDMVSVYIFELNINFWKCVNPYKFSVSSKKNNNCKSKPKIDLNFLMFSCMINYNFFLTHHVHYTPFTCGKRLLKFLNFESILESSLNF
jgi:hypothetical protein